MERFECRENAHDINIHEKIITMIEKGYFDFPILPTSSRKWPEYTGPGSQGTATNGDT